VFGVETVTLTVQVETAVLLYVTQSRQCISGFAVFFNWYIHKTFVYAHSVISILTDIELMQNKF